MGRRSVENRDLARLDDGCLESIFYSVFVGSEGDGELFERAAARPLEHAGLVAARVLSMGFRLCDAVTPGLCNTHRLGSSEFELLLEMRFLERAVAFGN